MSSAFDRYPSGWSVRDLGERRRLRLANEVMARQAISLSDPVPPHRPGESDGRAAPR